MTGFLQEVVVCIWENVQLGNVGHVHDKVKFFPENSLLKKKYKGPLYQRFCFPCCFSVPSVFCFCLNNS